MGLYGVVWQSISLNILIIMKSTIDYKHLHLTPIEELIDADFGKPGTPERNAFDESAQRFVDEYKREMNI